MTAWWPWCASDPCVWGGQGTLAQPEVVTLSLLDCHLSFPTHPWADSGMWCIDTGGALTLYSYSFTPLYLVRVPLNQVQSIRHRLGEAGTLEEFRKDLQLQVLLVDICDAPLRKWIYMRGWVKSSYEIMWVDWGSGDICLWKATSHTDSQRCRMISVSLVLESFSHLLWKKEWHWLNIALFQVSPTVGLSMNTSLKLAQIEPYWWGAVVLWEGSQTRTLKICPISNCDGTLGQSFNFSSLPFPHLETRGLD